MVEQTNTGYLTVLEEQGLDQPAHILENYGIDNETDVSSLDQDDLCNPTTLNYRCSHSLTNEPCSRIVSR